ncbi:MAG TPA: aspartate kinase [candidate division Zixibacteria bacterium]|nr:aspartate kinase [candidate division Zixibacteria bacterium]
MALIVQKYGGSSLADAGRIKAVAARIVRTRRRGNRVVAVVSAMGDTTDDLVKLARQVTPAPGQRELDMLLTAGERISMSLLAMAIADLGGEAISYTGSQVGIITDARHNRARILEIRAERLKQALDQGKIAIVAGFQGVSLSREVTTLGRGGSDTTAVALAVALEADACEVYSDVAGVYSADPRLVPGARKLPSLSFEEMLELASSGAQVLHPRAAGLAARHRMPVRCLSSFNNDPGTHIGKARRMERVVVRGITHDKSLAMLALSGVPRGGRTATQVVAKLAEREIAIKSFFHGAPGGKRVDLFFVISEADLEPAREVMGRCLGRLKGGRLSVNRRIGSVSLVGSGVGGEAGIIARMLEALAGLRIHVEGLTSSEIKVTCFMDRGATEKAVMKLHKTFIG